MARKYVRRLNAREFTCAEICTFTVAHDNELLAFDFDKMCMVISIVVYSYATPWHFFEYKHVRLR